MTRPTERSRPLPVDVGSDRVDTLFDVLSHPWRRYLLHRLQAGSGRTTMDEMADEIAAWTDERAADGRPSRDADTVEASLRHVHVPQMVDADVLVYDGGQETIALSEQATRTRPHLNAVVHG